MMPASVSERSIFSTSSRAASSTSVIPTVETRSPNEAPNTPNKALAAAQFAYANSQR